MSLYLDDITAKDQFYPFTQIRSLADLRVGILTIREKAEFVTGAKVIALSEDKDAQGTIIPANKVPSLEDEELNSPWDIIFHNDAAIASDFQMLTNGRKSQPLSPTNGVTEPQNIFLEEGANVEHCIINASTGPVYIGRNALIMEGAILRGPVAVCEGAVVKIGAKIYGGTTIGPYSVVGGEIKNCVFLGYSNKAHDGYLGDSMIGEWCNIGAGTSNSNVKNNAENIMAWNNANNQFISVGRKAGLLLGDYSRCAINTSFNTGTVVGISCNIFAPGLQSKFIADFSWGGQKYELEKAFRDINNWMAFKGKELTQEQKQTLINIYNHA